MATAARTAGASLDALESRLGHTFAQRSLLREALTHRSVLGRGRAQGRGRRTYERLEFLGDRVLGLIVAELLCERFPAEAEGSLTKRQVALISEPALVAVARQLELGAWIDVAGNDEHGGEGVRPSIQADACEAVIGALYLDGGLPAARGFVEREWDDLLRAAPQPPRDAKTELQEWAQGRGMAQPLYTVVAVTGPAHQPHYRVEATVGEAPPSSGEGRSKQAAEFAAARGLLEALRGVAHE